jgi:hypothetical protein
MEPVQVWVVIRSGRGGRETIEDGVAYKDQLDALKKAGSGPLLQARPLTLIPSSLSSSSGPAATGT